MSKALTCFTRKELFAFALTALISAGTPAFAEGGFDPSFGNGGRLLIDVSAGHSDQAYRFILTKAGKLLIGGTCVGTEGANSFTTFCITQLRADGSYDGTFGPGGLGYLSLHDFAGFPNNASLGDMIELSDGRIAMLGAPTDGTKILLAILSADGTRLDPSVGGGAGFLELQFGGISNTGTSLTQQPDGKIVIGGGVTSASNNIDFAALRLRADLSGLDTSFGVQGIQTIPFDLGGPSGDNSDVCQAVRIQANGKIVLVGYSDSSPSGQTPSGFQLSLTRLNADGSRDLSFGGSGDGRLHYLPSGIAAAAYDAQIDASNRIVLAGVVADGTNVRWLVDRLEQDGTHDADFNGGSAQEFLQPPGNGATQYVRLALASDGIFVVGNAPRTSSSAQNYFAVAHLNLNGSLDSRFGNGGRAYGSFTATNDFDTTGIGIAPGNGGLMVIGTQTQTTNLGYNEQQFGVARLQYDQIFRYGFD